MQRTKAPPHVNGSAVAIHTPRVKRRRDVAHLWADKRVLRFIRKRFNDDGNHGKHLLLVYLALCQIDSDFGEGVEIKSFTKTVATYSHLSRGTVGRYLRAFQKADIIDFPQHQEETPSGPRFGAKTLDLYEWIEENEDRMEDTIRRVLRLRLHKQPEIGTVAPPRASAPTSTIKNPSKEGSIDKNSSKEESGMNYARVTQRLFDLWNNMSKESGIPSVRGGKPSPIRKKRIKEHVRRHGVSQIKLAMTKVHTSKFCRGENDRGWRATFDWFFKAETERSLKSSPIILALEGQYDGGLKGHGNRILAGHGKYRRDIRTGEPVSGRKWWALKDIFNDEGKKISTVWQSADGETVESTTRPE